MSAPTTAPPGTLDPAERTLRSRILTTILWVSIVDLILLVALVYGAIAGPEWISPALGPVHGIGVVVEIGLVVWGSKQGWWGWWYTVVTVVTTGPPGAILGHGKAKREALGAA